jgi:class 3 adenylate cyclase
MRTLQSILYSLDGLVVVSIYILPKLADKVQVKDSSEYEPDLFMEATIMSADVCGFNAWSSVREATQVFRFLEAIYEAFDELADKRGVFKVDTVGDCYSKYH